MLILVLLAVFWMLEIIQLCHLTFTPLKHTGAPARPAFNLYWTRMEEHAGVRWLFQQN